MKTLAKCVGSAEMKTVKTALAGWIECDGECDR